MKTFKKYLLFPLLIFSIPAFTQDLIHKRNGVEILTEIKKVTENRIIFRMYNSKDTSLYAVSRVDVEFIKYADGGKEVFEKPDSTVNVTGSERGPGIQDGWVRKDFRTSVIEIKGNNYYLYGERYGYLRMINLLSTSANPDVLKGVKDYRKAHRTATILGWGSLGLGITSLLVLAMAEDISTTYDQNGQVVSQDEPTLVYMGLAGLVGAVGSAGMFTASIVIKKKDRQQAIRNAVLAHNKSLGF
jgi:hypothetical protein